MGGVRPDATPAPLSGAVRASEEAGGEPPPFLHWIARSRPARFASGAGRPLLDLAVADASLALLVGGASDALERGDDEAARLHVEAAGWELRRIRGVLDEIEGGLEAVAERLT
jgi:hypothetical protein